MTQCRVAHPGAPYPAHTQHPRYIHDVATTALGRLGRRGMDYFVQSCASSADADVLRELRACARGLRAALAGHSGGRSCPHFGMGKPMPLKVVLGFRC